MEKTQKVTCTEASGSKKMLWLMLFIMLFLAFPMVSAYGLDGSNAIKIQKPTATISGNVTNNYYNISNVTYLNASETDPIYSADKITYSPFWYNMTIPFTNWLSTFAYDYNQTIPAQDYCDGQISAIDFSTKNVNKSNFWDNLDAPLDVWLSTYNSTYDAKVSYVFGNCGAGEVVQNTTASGVQCITPTGVGDGSYNATYDATTKNWNGNSTMVYNHTADVNTLYGKWFYNMTQPFTDWLGTFAYNYNQTTATFNMYNNSWSETYNATYNAKVSAVNNGVTLALNNLTAGTMGTNLALGVQNITWTSNNLISDNTTCIQIKGATSSLWIC